MLEKATERFSRAMDFLMGKSHLTEKNIKEGLRQIKLCLLESDVDYKVVKDLMGVLEEEALGVRVLKSMTPKDQLMKVVYDKLVEVLGGEVKELEVKRKGLTKVMLVGLQGSGKTTTCVKLGKKLGGEGMGGGMGMRKRVCAISLDLTRPSARDQLRIFASEGGVDYLDIVGDSAIEICGKGLEESKRRGYDVLMIDTAGRLEVDLDLMGELKEIDKVLEPDETLFVCDAMMGQSVVGVLEGFKDFIEIDGVILSKFDSDSGGGAALSIKKATGKSIKYMGTGEKVEDLEKFYPERIADRILGRGDLMGFVERMEGSVDSKVKEEEEARILKGEFDLDDFLDQIHRMRKLGSLESLMSLLPFGKVRGVLDERDFLHKEAMILSMTKKERKNWKILNGSRKRRIARGSGRSIQELNRLLKKFEEMRKMLKKVKNNPNFLKGILGRISIFFII